MILASGLRSLPLSNLFYFNVQFALVGSSSFMGQAEHSTVLHQCVLYKGRSVGCEVRKAKAWQRALVDSGVPPIGRWRPWKRSRRSGLWAIFIMPLPLPHPQISRCVRQFSVHPDQFHPRAQIQGDRPFFGLAIREVSSLWTRCNVWDSWLLFLPMALRWRCVYHLSVKCTQGPFDQWTVPRCLFFVRVCCGYVTARSSPAGGMLLLSLPAALQSG